MSLRIKILILFLICTNQLCASDSLSTVFKKRKIGLGISSAVISAGSLLYLNQVWYKPYKSSVFHTFNDNSEWLQMDKYGHTITTYQTGRIIMETMNWSGFSKNGQLLGGLSGLFYMSIVEVMDGYSSGWGFSWGDMAANAVGSGVAIGQKAIWNEQRLQLKVSFRPSSYAMYRPDQLGDSFVTQMLKDYNGQTYWLSINPSSFFKKENRFPKCLNVCVGYGANGMIGAKYNNIVIQDDKGNTITFNRYRQYYLSLDLDLTRIRTRSKILKALFSGLNIVKIPFPNMELSEGKLKFNYY